MSDKLDRHVSVTVPIKYKVTITTSISVHIKCFYINLAEQWQDVTSLLHTRLTCSTYNVYAVQQDTQCGLNELVLFSA